MMNIKSFLIAVFSLSCAISSFGQSNLLNAKSPSQIGIKTEAQKNADNDKPLAYGYVHDRDILMSRTTWEIIDLGEKINFPLYFPIDTANVGTERRSLYDVLIKGIKKGKITEVYTDSYFNTKKSFKDIKASLSRIDTTDAGREQLNAGMKISPEYIVQQDLTSQDVTQYKIKGVWYFDKRQSELKYRLLGICPVTPDVYTMNSEDPDFIELFWVFFPDARETLFRATAFNEKNSSMPITFDQILNSRRFNSIIYREENVYGDRDIKDYMRDNSQSQLLESDRVKDKIRSFEQDMWNY